MELLSKKSDERGKRDSVPLAGRLSFLYAYSHPQAEATYPKTWTSSPFGPCGPASSYLVLQPIRFTPPKCHHPMRELLPRVFTLTSVEAVIFCGTCCYPKGHLPVRKYGALRCPDFPRAGSPGPRQSPLIAAAKIRLFVESRIRSFDVGHLHRHNTFVGEDVDQINTARMTFQHLCRDVGIRWSVIDNLA